ncbi:DUF4118 domain-containing protein [Dactylosporangium sp. CS-047395]|uniref:DUF4118 domain-containing protein n=1 Tax=Dactylosporangium sp. CS-047395 TaxID=3239936 RepID=UPI003D8EDD53
MHVGSLSWLVRPTTSPRWLGIAVAALLIVAETMLVYPLRRIVTPFDPSMVYIAGVLIASMMWGMWLGIATATASTLAFAYFHVQPSGRFAVADVRDIVGLAMFLVLAVATSAVAHLARLRAAHAEESGCTAEMARLLLRADDLPAALPAVARCIARSFNLPGAALHRTAVPGDDRHTAFPLQAGGERLGTLVVPAGLPEPTVRRLRLRVVPALTSLLHAGCELAASREHLRRLAAEQAALDRVARLVAAGCDPLDVFTAITTELHGLLPEYSTWLCRYEPGDAASVVATSLTDPEAKWAHWTLEGDNVLVKVRDTGRAARVDDFADMPGPVAAFARDLGVHSSVGVPILVEGRLWGVAAVAWTRPEPLPAGTAERIAAFTDLAATAIANADSRAELAASRARLVAAADQARERIERNLHDTALQHLLAVAMQFGVIQAGLPPELEQTRRDLSRAVSGLNSAVDDLREVARGIHPTMLAVGGLPPALKALARRSPVPVDLDLRACPRMHPVLEVAAYHVVSEALTNAARHAGATEVQVRAVSDESALHLSIRDDGVGGADPRRGAGLIALQDRVEALGGQFTISSPAGAGTTLRATIPSTPPETGDH